MSAQIRVLNGPDQNRTFSLTEADVRIGCGAGHAVQLRDPAWTDGDLLVQARGSSFLVTNRLPHSIFLDGQPLAVGQARTWYAGVDLQPTAQTRLRLEVPTPQTTAPAAALAEKKKQSNWRTLGLLVAFVVALVWVVVLPYWQPAPKETITYDTLQEHFDTAIKQATGPDQLRLRQLWLQIAATYPLEKSETMSAQARKEYWVVRDQADAQRKDWARLPVYELAWRFALERLARLP